MKKLSIIIVMAVMALASCKKMTTTDVAPGNNDPNYDAHNRIFRVKASSTSTFKLVITEYANDGVTPYNTQNADQTTPFDYGFTPVVGHKITVSIQSASGVITASTLYKGVYLDPMTIKTSGSGSTADFTYTVKE